MRSGAAHAWLTGACLAALVARAPAAAGEETESGVTLGPSAYVAGLAYAGHPYRQSGIEAETRLDLWRGLAWSTHAAYTIDALFEEETGGSIPADAGSRVTTRDAESFFHDLAAGGRIAPLAELPAWVFAEGHALLGETAYGDGWAGFAGAGGDLGWARIEAGAGGVSLEADRGLTVSGRAAVGIADWLEIAAIGLFTRNDPDDPALGSGDPRFAYGVESRIGPFGDFKVDLRWLGGKRVLAIDRLGTVVENLPDLMRDTLLATLTLGLGPRAGLFAGGGFRWAEAPAKDDYTLASGFIGGWGSF